MAMPSSRRMAYMIASILLVGFPMSYPTAFAQDNSLAIPKTMIDSEILRELNHLPQENAAYRFNVLDWSADGKFILFGYHDYAYTTSGGLNSLAIIDAETFNITKLDLPQLNANNIPEIYMAKISPSSDSIFMLLGNNSHYPSEPEDVFKYDLTSRSLTRITYSSNVIWFDTLKSSNTNKTLAYISDHFHFWPVDDSEAGTRIDKVAGRYYVFFDHYSSSSQIGKLDANDDATKLAFAGGPLDTRGIIHIDVLSGKITTIPPRNPCVSSVEFAPNEGLLLYSEYPGQSCPDSELEGLSLQVASIDGTIDEVLYTEKLAIFDTVLSPDGKTAATFGFGEVQDDLVAEMILLDLARPLPEFGPIPMIVATSLIAGTIMATRLKANSNR
jgi:hypothetical protein